MQITFADNNSFDLIVAKGAGDIIFSPQDLIAKGERDVIEFHFDSTKYNMDQLTPYFINADDLTHTITLTDDSGSIYVHTDYVIRLKFGLDYIDGEVNPRIILRLGQLTETDKTLRAVAGKVKVYTGTELEIAIAKKCDEVSAACESTIEAGIDYNDEHYSLTSQDQTNILCWRGVASSGSGVPYHADGKHCRMYTAEEFVALSNTAIAHITHNTTYCNLLMRWIETLTDLEQIHDVVYGETALTGTYLEEYNTVMNAITGGAPDNNTTTEENESTDDTTSEETPVESENDTEVENEETTPVEENTNVTE